MLVLPVLASSAESVLCRTVGFVIGFSTFLMGCVDYSRLREGSATRLSEIIVDKCVSKYASSSHSSWMISNEFIQVSWTNIPLLPTLPRILYLANHFIHPGHSPSHRHVQFLHASPQDTRRKPSNDAIYPILT